MWRNFQCQAVVIKRNSIKFCVKDRNEKSITFCFPKLKAKEKANFSKIIGETVTFLWNVYVTSFKVSVYSLAVVRGLPTIMFVPKCVNKKSSSERRYFV